MTAEKIATLENSLSAAALMIGMLGVIIIFGILDAYVSNKEKKEKELIQEGKELGIVQGRAEGFENGVELGFKQAQQKEYEERQALRAHIKANPWTAENGSNVKYNASLLTYSGE